MIEVPFITIDKVLHPRFVSVDDAGKILGLKRQTIHNKTSAGTLHLPPFGRVVGIPHVYERSVVESVALDLGRTPDDFATQDDPLVLLDEFDRYNAFEATYVNSPFYHRVQRALGGN